MDWIPELIAADPDPKNPQNIKAHVRLTKGDEVIDIYPMSNTLDDANLKQWLHTIIAKNLAERDAALPKIRSLIGQPLTYTTPPDTSAFDAARQGVRAIIGLQQVKAAVTDAAILAAITDESKTLQSQLKTYVQNNPTVKIRDLF